jgi:hypothetical protein
MRAGPNDYVGMAVILRTRADIVLVLIAFAMASGRQKIICG